MGDLLKAGLIEPGEDVVMVDNDPSYGPCRFCGVPSELRMGMCFPCFRKSDKPAPRGHP